MIQYNETLRFYRKDFDWTLEQLKTKEKRIPKTNKPTGETYTQWERVGYYTKLEHLLNQILDLRSGEANDLDELRDIILSTKKELTDLFKVVTEEG